MGTKGVGFRKPSGQLAWMLELPALIRNAEAAGMPVIIEWRGPMPEHVRRLYESLGVLIRFLPQEGE